MTVEGSRHKQKGRPRGRPLRIQDRATLLRRQLHIRGSRAHLGVHLCFKLGKILLEHADQRTGGLVELVLVLPGVDRVEDLGRHPRQRGRDRKAEILVGAEFDVAKRAVERGGEQLILLRLLLII